MFGAKLPSIKCIVELVELKVVKVKMSGFVACHCFTQGLSPSLTRVPYPAGSPSCHLSSLVFKVALRNLHGVIEKLLD